MLSMSHDLLILHPSSSPVPSKGHLVLLRAAHGAQGWSPCKASCCWCCSVLGMSTPAFHSECAGSCCSIVSVGPDLEEICLGAFKGETTT